MGQLVAYLKAPTSVDAEPLQTQPFGIFPMKLPPILLSLPEPGSEPLNISAAGAPVRDGVRGGGLRIFAAAPATVPGAGVTAEAAQTQDGSFQRRWPAEQSFSWFQNFFRPAAAPEPAARETVAEVPANPPEPILAAPEPVRAPARQNGPMDLSPDTSAFAPTPSQPAWLSSARIR
jgi:hypothetical protein